MALNQDVKLYNILEKDGETRFIITKTGAFFGLTYENISQLKEIFEKIENDEAGLREEISRGKQYVGD